jgi:pentose-5-phosphate-3-epimerase
VQVEKTTGLLMLQRVEPVALLGTVACLLTGPDAGWTTMHLARSQDHDIGFALEPKFEVSATLDVALRLAVLLMVTSSQGATTTPEMRQVDIGGSVRVDGKTRYIRVSIEDSAELKVFAQEDGGISVRLTPSLAKSVASMIVSVASEMWRTD